MSSASGTTEASTPVDWSSLSSEEREQCNRKAAKPDGQGYVKPRAYQAVSVADQSNLSLFVTTILIGVLAGLALGLPAAGMGHTFSHESVSVEEIRCYSIPIGIAISTVVAAGCLVYQRKKAREALQSEDLTAGGAVHKSDFSLSARIKKLMARLFQREEPPAAPQLQ